jgi:toxin ParE1/3/4
MSPIIRRPAANRDLVTSFRYYAREASLRVADRFFAEAEATFARLSSMPGLGTRYEPHEPLYADVRYFPVSRFRAHIVFYRIVPGNGIEVFRVLHGAQDIHATLAEEFRVDEDTGGDQAVEEPP